MDNKELPFSDKRWHDNPFQGAIVRDGKPRTKDDEEKAKKELRDILRKEGILKDDKDNE